MNWIKWIFKYKKAKAKRKKGYECSECEADCDNFKCPCKPGEKLVRR